MVSKHAKQKGFSLSVFGSHTRFKVTIFLTIIDKHANTFSEYQVLVHINVHECIPIKAGS